MFGHIEQFDLHGGDFVEYVERLNQYFLANGIEELSKKRAMFITLIGTETYSLLRNLLAPRKPFDVAYNDLVRTLTEHLTPKTVVIAERFKFYERRQRDDESVCDFVAELRRLASKCEFGYFLEDALRDRLVCGLRDVKVRKRLLIEHDLTLVKAIEISKSLEGVELEIKVMGEGMSSVKTEDVHKMKPTVVKKRCFRCGDESHLANQCFTYFTNFNVTAIFFKLPYWLH